MRYTKIITLCSLFAVSHVSIAHDHDEHDKEKHHAKEMMHDASEHHHGTSGDTSGHWMAPAKDAARINPVQQSKQSVKRGSLIFLQNCASCHGDTAEGDGMAGMMLNPKPTNLREMAGGHSDGDFFYKISNGRGAMPAWKASLSENQRWDLVNFVQSLETENNHGSDHKDSHDHGHNHSENAHHH